ncbi:hypothetical protein PspLS_10435 [Pyricularia sp. CBS 133598]|nr:hypothetical protein PspLS_10435 [Pyricularia sp. CBS 133598]
MSSTEENQGFSVLVTCTLHDGKRDEYLAHMQQVITHLAKEPEFLHIEVMRVRNSPHKITYIEHWAKPLDFFIKNISHKPYIAEYVKVTEPLLAEKRQTEVLDRCGGPWARTRDGNFSMM